MSESTASKGWTLALRSVGADTLEIVVYDMIGKDPFFGDGFGAGDFVAALRSAPAAKKISLRINSVGGYLDDAKSMINLLRERSSQGVEIEAHVDGLAASAAAYLLTAADKVVVPSNAFLMIHEARCGMRGRADDMETAARTLRLDNEIVAEAYAGVSKRRGKNLTKDDFLSAMAKGDVYLTAGEAVAWGLADETVESVKAAACLVDITGLASAPPSLRSAPYVAAERPVARTGDVSAAPSAPPQQTIPEAIPPVVEQPTARVTGHGAPMPEENQPPAASEPASVTVSGVKLLGVATEAEAHTRILNLTKLNAALMSATGASTDAEALARVMAWKHGADQTEALVRQVAELKSSNAASQKEATIQKLSREGKLAPAMHDWARANFATAESLETFALSLPPMVQLGSIQEQNAGDKKVALTEEDHKVIASLGITTEAYIAERKLELERAAKRQAGG